MAPATESRTAIRKAGVCPGVQRAVGCKSAPGRRLDNLAAGLLLRTDELDVQDDLDAHLVVRLHLRRVVRVQLHRAHQWKRLESTSCSSEFRYSSICSGSSSAARSSAPTGCSADPADAGDGGGDGTFGSPATVPEVAGVLRNSLRVTLVGRAAGDGDVRDDDAKSGPKTSRSALPTASITAGNGLGSTARRSGQVQTNKCATGKVADR